MKNLVYNLLKLWIKGSLHLYFGKIIVKGLDNVPKDKPVLFLPNHQNALLDPLLIAVDCNRKPYFLTRSDVFKSSVLNRLFDLVRMIPVYRIRDGRDSLKNNNAVFQKCADLLGRNESLLMFPEANHNLERRVRPLSKGFTRILFKTLEQNQDLDISLVPVGLNYRSAEDFPDRVSIFFGKDLSVQDLLVDTDRRTQIEIIKKEVSESLKKLTTHVPLENYDESIKKLDASGVDYLNPRVANSLLKNLNGPNAKTEAETRKGLLLKILFPLFYLLNLPVILLWKYVVKPKVWEPEFTATLRFGTALAIFPVYYLLLLIGLSVFIGPFNAFLIVIAQLVFNRLFVRAD